MFSQKVTGYEPLRDAANRKTTLITIIAAVTVHNLGLYGKKKICEQKQTEILDRIILQHQGNGDKGKYHSDGYVTKEN